MKGELVFNIDVMLAKRKMSVTELADIISAQYNSNNTLYR